MGDTREPAKDARDGDSVTTPATEPAKDTEEDLQAMLAEAEAEAAEAEAAAAAARARVRAMRSQEVDEPAEVIEDEGKPGGWRGRFGWPVVAKIIAVIIIVASLAGSGWIVWQYYDARARREHAQEFVDTAKQTVVDLTSIDFHKVKDQVQHIVDNSTGSFRDDFINRSDQFIKVAEASKAVAKGTVDAAAVESMTTDEAVVLVVGSEQITNAVGNQQPRSFRFRVTVTKDGDQFKVSKLELVL